MAEIVHLGPDRAPLFYDLMRRLPPQHFMAFDLLWLDGRDMRGLPLLERKRLLRRIIPPQPSPVLAVDHVAGSGVALYEAACARDLEGVVAKLARGSYTPEATTWVKIKIGPTVRRRAFIFDTRAEGVKSVASRARIAWMR